MDIASRWPVPSQYLCLIVLFQLLFCVSFSHKKICAVPPKSVPFYHKLVKNQIELIWRKNVCMCSCVCVYLLVQSKEEVLIYKNFKCELGISLIPLSRLLLLMISTPLFQKVFFFLCFLLFEWRPSLHLRLNLFHLQSNYN